MKVDKTVLTLGLASIVPLALYAVATLTKKRSKKSSSFVVDSDTEWVLECMDDMIADMKEMKKKQDEQGDRMAKLEGMLEILHNEKISEGNTNE